MTCIHMTQNPPTGACWECAPGMFRFSPEQIEASNKALAQWRAGYEEEEEGPPPPIFPRPKKRLCWRCRREDSEAHGLCRPCLQRVELGLSVERLVHG